MTYDYGKEFTLQKASRECVLRKATLPILTTPENLASTKIPMVLFACICLKVLVLITYRTHSPEDGDNLVIE